MEGSSHNAAARPTAGVCGGVGWGGVAAATRQMAGRRCIETISDGQWNELTAVVTVWGGLVATWWHVTRTHPTVDFDASSHRRYSGHRGSRPVNMKSFQQLDTHPPT